MRKKKPTIIVDLDGPMGNIFFVALMALKALKKDGAGQETVSEFLRNLKECHSYREAIDMIGEYVTIKAWKGGVPMK